MQVALPSLQHEVLIEAVENHTTPRSSSSMKSGASWRPPPLGPSPNAAVQLIATAHGNTLDNLLLNPTLSDLVGGIESVTLSDEEAADGGPEDRSGASRAAHLRHPRRDSGPAAAVCTVT